MVQYKSGKLFKQKTVKQGFFRIFLKISLYKICNKAFAQQNYSSDFFIWLTDDLKLI